jgi:hypothetical protein
MDEKNRCPECGYGSDEAFTECPACAAQRKPGTGSPKNKITLVVVVLLAVWGVWSWIGRDSGAGKAGRSELRISAGERVDLAGHLAEGRHTVFLFYADW